MTTLSSKRFQVPPQPTPFIGRRVEREQITALLRDPAVRVLTLVGVGGVGKSRLSLAAAEDAAPDFPDGVVFVALSALTDGDHIPDALAQSLGLSIEGLDEVPAFDQISGWLANRRMLIILDNFEHVIDAAPLVQTLALAAPLVTFLVTSRERLSIRAERAFLIEGMTLSESSCSDVGVAMMTDPVRLFVASASRVRVDFQLTSDDLEGLHRICTLVDGVPLGLELAASWVDTLSLAEIADEIQRGLDFLETNARDIPDRQRSLRAAFDTSWQRLTPDEQRYLARLAIFQGGFTRRAAAAVADADLRTLQGFINKSLLRRELEDRYEVHEVVRGFAQAHLNEWGEAHQTRIAHCAYYMERLRLREADVKGADQLAGLDGIEIDFENFRMAWTTAHEFADWEGLNGGLECLFWFCMMRNRYVGGDAMLNMAEKSADPRLARRAALRRLWLKRWTSGAFNPAKGEITLIQAALDAALDAEDWCEAAVCRTLLGDALSESDPKRAEECLRDALDAFDGEIADPFYAAWALHFMARHAASHQGLKAGIALHHESVDRRRRCGDRAGEIYGMFNLAYDLFRARRLNDAYATAQKMQEASLTINERSGVLLSSTIFAMIAFVRGDLERAAALNDTNMQLARDLNHRLGAAYADLLRMLLADSAGFGVQSGMIQIVQNTVSGDMLRTVVLLETLRESAGEGETEKDRVEAVNETLPEPLTDRELEILVLLAQGLSNNEIADTLFVGLSTVKKHITHLYGKLDVTTRTQALLRGQELGLIDIKTG